MNRIILFVFTITFTLFATNSIHAQSEPDNYQKITYYSVDKEGLNNFLKSVQDWKASHQTQINATDRLAWRLYRVPFSSSANAWYNFITIEISTNLNSLQSPDRNTVQTLREATDHQMKLSYAVHSEIWFTEKLVYETEESPSRYINTNFMYAIPESLDEYLELETEIAKPLHQNQTNNNRMNGWNFNRLIFPTGTILDYNFITTDFYSSLEQIEMVITREVIMRVHPDMDVDEFEDFADSIRERVWSDLWELVEYAD